MRYAVVIEKTETGFAAYPPDLPGVGVASETLEGVQRLIREAIEMHLSGLRQDGLPIPEPVTRAGSSGCGAPPEQASEGSRRCRPACGGLSEAPQRRALWVLHCPEGCRRRE